MQGSSPTEALPNHCADTGEAQQEQKSRQAEEWNLENGPHLWRPLVDELVSEGFIEARRPVLAFAGRSPPRGQNGGTYIRQQDAGADDAQDSRQPAHGQPVEDFGEVENEDHCGCGPIGFTYSHGSEQKDKRRGRTGDERNELGRCDANNHLDDGNDDADPEALLAQVIDIPGSFHCGPKDTLQAAVGALGFSGKSQRLHARKFRGWLPGTSRKLRRGEKEFLRP